MGNLERKILWGVVLGALVYAGIALWSDARGLVESLASFPLSVFLLALGLSVVNYGFRFLKWQIYLKALKIRVPAKDSFIIFIAGMAMSLTPGKLGEVLKSVLLKERYQVELSRSAPVVFAERLTDLLGLLVIAGLGIAVFEYGRAPFFLTLGGVTLLVGVLNQPKWVGWGLDLVEKLPVVGRFRAHLDRPYQAARRLMRFKILSVTTLLSVIGWAMEAGAFYLILQSLGGSGASVQLAAFIFAMTTILGAISFLPGGLGVAEASMIGVLLVLGVFQDESSATAATYLTRFATLWFGVILGLVALAVWRLGAQRAQDEPREG